MRSLRQFMIGIAIFSAMVIPAGAANAVSAGEAQTTAHSITVGYAPVVMDGYGTQADCERDRRWWEGIYKWLGYVSIDGDCRYDIIHGWWEFSLYPPL